MPPKLTIAEIEQLVDSGLPNWRSFASITALGERDITLEMPFRDAHLRGGGTIAGPVLMALADAAGYFITIAHAGVVANATTVNLDIHFLTRPGPAAVTAIATLLRLGTRLAVSRVEIFSGGQLVAHATVTYAIPSIGNTTG
jgi:uncharacterized protein (TIGR00369 family)